MHPVAHAPRTTSTAALAAGALQVVAGIVMAVDPGETDPTLRPVEHVVLGLYATALLLLVPGYLGLASRTRSRRGVQAACVGMVLLAVGMTATNLHDGDYAWFPAVAIPANALWLFGTLALAVSLWRTPGVRRWVALGVVLTWICTIPLSQLGGGLLAGAYWLAVGATMRAGTAVDERVPDRVSV